MSKLLARSDLTDADLADLYAYPPGPWLRANMVASADGAANLEGVSAGLSSAPTGTRSRCSAPSRTSSWLARRPCAPSATRRSARASCGATCAKAGRRRRRSRSSACASISTRPAACSPIRRRTRARSSSPAARHRRIAAPSWPSTPTSSWPRKDVDLKAAVEALAERGYQRILAEGGPHLLAQLLAVGLLDELCLTVAPLMTGPVAGRIVAGSLAPERPLPLTLAHVIEADDFLLCRYARKDNLSRTGRGARRRGRALGRPSGVAASTVRLTLGPTATFQACA